MWRMSLFILTALTICVYGDDAWSALSLCMDSTRCLNLCTSGQYCCPNGKTQKTCPTWWGLDLSTNECTRESVSAGDDAKGYKTTQYGSCTPSQTFCYDVYNDNQADAKCFECR